LICGTPVAPLVTFAMEQGVFAFFSNRLGCLGSIAISIIGTVILSLLMWAIVGR
jgi:hypothetical protein